jgi:signal-transduction protein with cAMP-binding, CBS, and nucleotidyltransferase domain
MKRNPQVVAFMTPFPNSIDVDAPLAQAHALMRKHQFRHLPVTSNQAIVGILTDRDIKLCLPRVSAGAAGFCGGKRQRSLGAA